MKCDVRVVCLCFSLVRVPVFLLRSQRPTFPPRVIPSPRVAPHCTLRNSVRMPQSDGYGVTSTNYVIGQQALLLELSLSEICSSASIMQRGKAGLRQWSVVLGCTSISPRPSFLSPPGAGDLLRHVRPGDIAVREETRPLRRPQRLGLRAGR